MLERVGLAAAARKRLGSYSRGMLRRFGLAQAFVHDPEVLLLDEPTAGLDALGFEVADLLLAEARARGATVVIASHVLGELTAHCADVAVLVGGAVVARGAPGELSHALGPDAWTEIAVEGLTAEGLGALRARIEELGASYRGAQPAQHDLIALYKRHGVRGGP
jgi:ABC-type multidrug transport system ATPase subunit